MNHKIDRRVARTQRSMREALIRLLRRRRYADITVQEILDEADIGRSTFYAHCSGKDELVRLSFRMLRAELTADVARASSDGASLLPFSLVIIRHLAQHSDLHGSFADRAANDLIFSELRQLVQELAKADLKRMAGLDLPLDVALQFIAGAFTGLVTWWLAGKTKLAPETLDLLFQKLVGEGLAGSSAT